MKTKAPKETEEVKEEVTETNKIDYKSVGLIIDDFLSSFARTYGNGRDSRLPRAFNDKPIYTILTSFMVCHCDRGLVRFMDINNDFLGLFNVIEGTYHTDYGSRNIINHHKFNIINSFCNMLAKVVRSKMSSLPPAKNKDCVAYPITEEIIRNIDSRLPNKYGLAAEQIELFKQVMHHRMYYSNPNSNPDLHLLYDIDGSVVGYEINKKSLNVRDIMSRRSSDPGFYYKLEHGLIASEQMIIDTTTDIYSSIIGKDIDQIKLGRRKRSLVYTHNHSKHISFETGLDSYSSLCLYVLNSIIYRYDKEDEIYKNVEMFKNMIESDDIWDEIMGINYINNMKLDFVDRLSKDILNKLISLYDNLNMECAYAVFEPASLRAVIKMMIIYLINRDYRCRFYAMGRPNLTNSIVSYFINKNISVFSLVKSKIDDDKHYRMTSESSEYAEAICEVIISLHSSFKELYL